MQPQLGAAGQLFGPPKGSLGEIALFERLQPPGDPADKVFSVVRSRWLANDVVVLSFELGSAHAAHGCDFAPNIQLHHILLKLESQVGLSGLTEPQGGPEIKA